MSKHGGKRSGAGRKSLEDKLGERIVTMTIRITESQYQHVSGQEMSAAEYVRLLIEQDMNQAPD